MKNEDKLKELLFFHILNDPSEEQFIFCECTDKKFGYIVYKDNEYFLCNANLLMLTRYVELNDALKNVNRIYITHEDIKNVVENNSTRFMSGIAHLKSHYDRGILLIYEE